MRESTAVQLGLKPVARIVSHAVHAQAPEWFSTAPAGAIDKALKKAGWLPGQVDLWEVNEAFAAVTMAAMAEFKLAHEIVNVHGGACALGHPIGASGARSSSPCSARCASRAEAWCRRAVHRRRRGHRDGGGTVLTMLMPSGDEALLFAAAVFVLNADAGCRPAAHGVAHAVGWCPCRLCRRAGHQRRLRRARARGSLRVGGAACRAPASAAGRAVGRRGLPGLLGLGLVRQAWRDAPAGAAAADRVSAALALGGVSAPAC